MENDMQNFSSALLIFLGLLSPIFDDLFGRDDDAFAAEEDATTVYGTDGDDVITADQPDMLTLLLDGDDTFEGTDGRDTAFGGPGDDVLLMRQGDDIADGGIGADRIDGGFGNDLLRGNAGNDELNGAGNDDEIYGGTGDDLLTGSGGDDTLYGESGDDVLYGHVEGGNLAQDGQDFLFGGEGNDTLYLAGNDTGAGGDGNDRFVIEETIEAGTRATISDYAASDDTIVVQYVPQTDPGTGDPITPTLTASNYAEGEGATIFQDGEAILNIDGVTDFDVSTITLEPVA